MIKIVLFDADGVIVADKMFSEELEKDYGIKGETLLPFFKGPFKKCLLGEADLREELLPYLKDWGWNGSVQELMNYWFQVEDEMQDEVVEIVKILKEHKIPCFVGTNQEQHRTNYMRNEMGFDRYFDQVWSSADLGVKKPDQEFYDTIYDLIANNHSVRREEVMFWDDTQENVGAANAAGLSAYFYSDFAYFQKVMKEHFSFIV